MVKPPTPPDPIRWRVESFRRFVQIVAVYYALLAVLFLAIGVDTRNAVAVLLVSLLAWLLATFLGRVLR